MAIESSKEREEEILAAVDLGSNSFHMIIARVRDGHFHVLDSLRDMVQLRAGLDAHGNLTAESQERALACLARFGERVSGLPITSVRAVGTNTLRVARNSHVFLQKARQALGHPIEIVAGEEEARLIYLGVAHALSFDQQRRLVMDIGGGSTEFIIGEGFTGLRRESLSMGCVSFTQQFFADGEITKKNLNAAALAARVQLRDIRREYREMGWEMAVGASGTIRCVASVVAANEWSDDGCITLAALDKLQRALLDAGHVDNLKLPGLSDERASILPAGVSVLRTSFQVLKIERMTVSDGALREGLLYDLVGRLHHDDERERTVTAMMKRYHVDIGHVDRIDQTAQQFLKQVAKKWQLDKRVDGQRLAWAVKLHEIGLAISHGSRHKHAAYLVANSDMSGFSREEQYALSVLIQGQRKAFPRKLIKSLPEEVQQSIQWLTVILRLALVFNRGRSNQAEALDCQLKPRKKGLKLTLSEDWLASHPLTEQDLLQEQAYLAKAKIKLKLHAKEAD